MTTQPRTLRSLIEASAFKAPARKPRQQARIDRILGGAQLLMAKFGRGNITMANLGLALEISTATLRRYFIDIDYLFSQILHRHLAELRTMLAEIPGNSASAAQARRAAYLAFTRTPDGALTDAHTLLVRDSHLLPEDLIGAIETERVAIGQTLAGPAHTNIENLFALLNDPARTAAAIEAALAPQPALPKPPPAPQRPATAPARPPHLSPPHRPPAYARTG